MARKVETIAIGLDGARKGWVAAILRADSTSKSNASAWETELQLLPGISSLTTLSPEQPDAPPVAIDVPIGLPEAVEYRDCDNQARARLRGRASCVFPPPARDLLSAGADYGLVQAWSARAKKSSPEAKGLSRQGTALIPKVTEVDAWLRAAPTRNDRVFECHPELIFLDLNSGVPLPAKKSGAGAIRRLRIVRQLFPDAEERIADFAAPGSDLTDALDAYGALAAALKCRRGEQRQLGDGGRDREGLPMRMVF